MVRRLYDQVIGDKAKEYCILELFMVAMTDNTVIKGYRKSLHNNQQNGKTNVITEFVPVHSLENVAARLQNQNTAGSNEHPHQRSRLRKMVNKISIKKNVHVNHIDDC